MFRFCSFYAPEIEDRGAYCFCPVRHSVILSFCPPLWNFNLANNFWTVCARALIFHMNIPCDNTFPWYHYFYPVTLTLEFDPFFENFNIAYNFWTVIARTLIFHMSNPCDKTFSWVPLFFTLWPWPWSLAHFFENFNLTNNFWTASARALIFHMNIPCDEIFF